MKNNFTNKTSEEKNTTLAELFKKHRKLMFHVAYDILNDEYQAEDAVQTAFYKLDKNKFKIDSVDCNKTKNFMVIIVRNVAIRIYNSNKKGPVLYDNDEMAGIEDDQPLPLDIIISNETVNDIERCMNELSPIYSDVLIMKHIADYTNQEIASFLDISEQLVRVRLYRAKKLLLDKINEGKKYNG